MIETNLSWLSRSALLLLSAVAVPACQSSDATQPTTDDPPAIETIARAADKRSHAAGHFVLEIDGANAGHLHSFEGGGARATVVTVKEANLPVSKKHVGLVSYDDVTIGAGVGMAASFYQWITDTIARKIPRHSGAIISADFEGNARARLDFDQALISEVTLPALDAADKTAAHLTVKLTPEHTRRTQGTGKSAAPVTHQKAWLASNFRFSMAGLDQSSARVDTIEALSFKQKVARGSAGEERDRLMPTALEYPNVVYTTSAAHAVDLSDWYVDFLENGNNADTQERSGKIEYLSTDAATVLFRLTLEHCGLVTLSPLAGAGDAIPRVRVELYCEDMQFAFESAAAGK